MGKGIKNSKLKERITTSYGLFYPGTSIRNPERNRELVRLFSNAADEYLTDDLAVKLYDAGLAQDLWTSKTINSNEDKVKKIKQIISELSTRAFVFLTINNRIILSSFKVILDPNTKANELTIKYMIGLWFSNPSTNAYKNRCNLFYLILKVIDEINKRIGPNEKQGIYREEIFYILIAQTNDYESIVNMILEKRKKYGKCKKPIEQLLEGINIDEYPQLKTEKGKIIDKDTIRSYTDVIARYLNLTDLFDVHGYSNPLVNFSKYATQKIQMLIKAFENGAYDQDFDSFKYTTIDDGLFTYDEGIDSLAYWENIYNLELPWEADNDFYSEQELHLFNTTYPDDPFVVRKDRIDKQLEMNKRKSFVDLLSMYNTTFEEVLLNPDKWAKRFSADYMDGEPLKKTAFFEGCVALYIWYLTKDIPNVSVIINTKLDDNGIPTGWASGSNLNHTGEDFRIVLPNGFINGEPSLAVGRQQANQECKSCTDHLSKVREQTNITHCYSTLFVPKVDFSTIYTCYRRDSDLTLIPMSIKYLIRVGNEWKKSKDCFYFMKKLDEIKNKKFANETEYLNEMNDE